MSDEISDYDYELPQELIARHPPERREEARLMVLDRASETWRHARVSDLPDRLNPGDLLVLNDTRVIPARLLGRRAQTGGRWEGLFLESQGDGSWKLLGQTRGKLQPGERIVLSPAHRPTSGEELALELLDRDEEGIWRVRPLEAIDPLAALEKFGTVPLPPYMERELAEDEDFERYQTRFASRPGSVAAPTAGLHFTPELFAACRQKGIDHAFVTLHVGIGTFRPVSAEKLSEHRMHSEWCELPAETAAVIHRAKQSGGRVVAVGTTTARTLESAAAAGPLAAWRGRTEIFIRPPYTFRTVDALLTNFHLPRSTLLTLVSAMAGREFVLRAYAEAIRERYRFFSYGDAMLIV